MAMPPRLVATSELLGPTPPPDGELYCSTSFTTRAWVPTYLPVKSVIIGDATKITRSLTEKSRKVCEVHAAEISERGRSVIVECIVPSRAEILHGARDARPVPVPVTILRRSGRADYGRNNNPMTNGIRRQRVERPTDGWPLSWKYGADFAGFYMPVYRQMARALRRPLEIDHSVASGMVGTRRGELPPYPSLPFPTCPTPIMRRVSLIQVVIQYR